MNFEMEQEEEVDAEIAVADPEEAVLHVSQKGLNHDSVSGHLKNQRVLQVWIFLCTQKGNISLVQPPISTNVPVFLSLSLHLLDMKFVVYRENRRTLCQRFAR